ncbi:MAG TPA: GDP-mannose 4,6-dehydratase [Candidatus Aminicenantes bacterium]|nr:GDP-mannose 4,6-dehydratase [Candidatus Aminicenantes bacterium]
MKKILITGGAGFIGSHLAEEFIRAEHEVWVLDDLSTGSLDNIRHLESHPHFRWVLGSVLDRDRVNDLVGACDEVYHMAGVVGVKLVVDDPIKTMNVNIMGTEIVLSASHAYGRKTLIVSTSEVYGKDVGHGTRAFSENDSIFLGTPLRWAYACSKAIDEYLAIAYHRKKGLPLLVVRIFNTIGPRQTGAYGMVIPRLVKQALRGEPMTVYGDGEQVRSFILVDDTVRAIVALMNESQAVGEIYNIGSEEAITIKDVAEKIKKMTGSRPPIVFIPYEEAYGSEFEDIRYRVPDTSKIKSAIGFAPSFDMDQILETIIRYHQMKLGISR